MNKTVFDTGRSEYYRQKKNRIRREEAERALILDDAVFIKHYGMDAYIKLFPDAVNQPMAWHMAVVKELQRLEKQELANLLTGTSLAYAATYSKKAQRAFNNMIKGMTVWTGKISTWTDLRTSLIAELHEMPYSKWMASMATTVHN